MIVKVVYSHGGGRVVQCPHLAINKFQSQPQSSQQFGPFLSFHCDFLMVPHHRRLPQPLFVDCRLHRLWKYPEDLIVQNETLKYCFWIQILCSFIIIMNNMFFSCLTNHYKASFIFWFLGFLIFWSLNKFRNSELIDGLYSFWRRFDCVLVYNVRRPDDWIGLMNSLLGPQAPWPA